MKFNWRIKSTGALVAHVDIRHDVTTWVIACALVHSYAGIGEYDDLPTNLTRAEVDKLVRVKLSRAGDNWMECSVWDDVPKGEDRAYAAWAGATVRRIWPEAAASDPQFNRDFPEASA